MLRALRVLIVEDNRSDAELVLRELRRAGFEPEWKRVDTETDFLGSLHPDWDIILSDFNMPAFSGLRALELLQESCLGIPFILISGTIGEDTAVEAMQKGAADYLLKDRLTRLGPAVALALSQYWLRKESEQTEEAMRQSEHKYRHLFESLGEAAFLIDRESRRILDANLCAQELLGRTRSEILGSDARNLFPVDETARDGQPFTSAIAPTIADHLEETEVATKDGRRIPVQFRFTPVEIHGRDLVLALMTDITARKRAEEVLRESERRFREMLENVALLALTMGADGIITFCNDYLLQTTGWSREEVVGADWCSRLTPRDPLARSRFLEIMATGEIPGHYENLIETRDCKLRDISWDNTLLRDAGGKILGVACIGKDVTEQKLAAARILEQAAMLDQARDAIIVCDIHTCRVTYWNQGAEHLYGWTAAEAEGREIGELVFTDPQLAGTVIDKLLRDGEWRGEHHHLTKGGLEWLASSHATLVRDPLGVPKSALVINFDITEQRELEERLRRSQRMESIGTLAGGIAHDFNNVLAPIMMAVGMLKMRLRDPASQELFAILAASAQHGADMVRQVLLFASGVDSRRQMDVRIGPLLLEIERIANDTFLKHIVVRLIVPDDLWAVTGDPTQVHQILLNLCVNARDAMPDGGTLTMSAENIVLGADDADRNPGSYVLLRVEDTGAGIPPEIVGKIFDPFFTTKAVGKGTGLGLSTTLEIVKNHGGFIRVDSEVGRGTAVEVSLPALTGKPEEVLATDAAAMPSGHDELILVVDDESSVRQIARQTLEAFGYRVVLASDGAEAIAIYAARHKEIAAVLSDLAMPVMSGSSSFEILRKINPAVRIIATSGLPSDDLVVSLGANHFLSKPYTAETLLGVLHDVLDSDREKVVTGKPAG